MGVSISSGTLIDAASLTGGGTISSDAPITNLQTSPLAQYTRWTSLTGMSITVDLGAAYAITFFGLFGHNGSSNGTWTITGATSQGDLTASPPPYTTGSMSLWPASVKPDETGKLHSLYYPPTAKSYRWWLIELSDSGNGDGYFDVGRIHIDAAWSPTYSIRLGGVPYFVDPSIREQSYGGQSWSRTVSPHRVADFSIPGLGADEMFNNAYELQRQVGTGRDVCFVRDTTATTHLHRQTVYGWMKSLDPIQNVAHGIYETPFVVEEIIA
jgi:hypothetical protein